MSDRADALAVKIFSYFEKLQKTYASGLPPPEHYEIHLSDLAAIIDDVYDEAELEVKLARQEVEIESLKKMLKPKGPVPIALSLNHSLAAIAETLNAMQVTQTEMATFTGCLARYAERAFHWRFPDAE